jgi:hypothetical protein
MGCTQINLSLCIQCVEYIDGNMVYKGMMTTHHNDHLHNFDISPARTHTKQSLDPPPPPPPTPTIHQNYYKPLTYSLLMTGTSSTFTHGCRLPQYRSIAPMISSKTLKKFPSLLIYNQILVHAADNIALCKTTITTKLTHHN